MLIVLCVGEKCMLQTRIEELKQYAFVIKQLSLKEHKRKTDETNLGVVWNVLNPLLYMVILSTYYQNVIIHKIENFPVFVFTGYTIFNYYSSATKGAMKCFVYNRTLISRTHSSLKIYIFQKVFVAFKELAFSGIAIIPVMFYFRINITPRIMLLVPILVLATMTIVGIGELLAIVFSFFGDIDYLYSVFMTMLLFVSGVFIPIDHIPRQFHRVLGYNPIFLSIYMARNSLIYNLPSHWSAWVKMFLWATISSFGGNFILNKHQNKILSRL